MSDELDEMRRLRDEALQFEFIDPLVQEYHRKSILMAWADLGGSN